LIGKAVASAVAQNIVDLPVSDLRARHGSALLPFDALERPLDEVSGPRCGRDSPAVTLDQAIDT